MVFASSNVPLIALSTASGRGIGAASSSPPTLVPWVIEEKVWIAFLHHSKVLLVSMQLNVFIICLEIIVPHNNTQLIRLLSHISPLATQQFTPQSNDQQLG